MRGSAVLNVAQAIARAMTRRDLRSMEGNCDVERESTCVSGGKRSFEPPLSIPAVNAIVEPGGYRKNDVFEEAVQPLRMRFIFQAGMACLGRAMRLSFMYLNKAKKH